MLNGILRAAWGKRLGRAPATNRSVEYENRSRNTGNAGRWLSRFRKKVTAAISEHNFIHGKRMKTVASLILCLFYVAAVVGLNAIADSTSPLGVTTVLSLIFLLTYWRFIRRRVIFPLLAVFVVTLVAPVSILFAIGMPHYHTWTSTAEAFISTLRTQGKIWGLEIFLPMLATVILGIILRRRSEKVRETSASN
jgi:hypothetical protein